MKCMHFKTYIFNAFLRNIKLLHCPRIFNDTKTLSDINVNRRCLLTQCLRKWWMVTPENRQSCNKKIKMNNVLVKWNPGKVQLPYCLAKRGADGRQLLSVLQMGKIPEEFT